MQAIGLAIALERRVIDQLTRLGDDSVTLAWLEDKEREIVRLLDDVKEHDPALYMYPALAAEWTDNAPQGEESDYSLAVTLELMQLVWLLQKTAQFYQQAAANTPYPSQQLFFSSLSKWKVLLRKRLEGEARHGHSRLWNELGFSPFPWEIG